MSKKTLILSQKQLNEIIGYANNPDGDIAPLGANQVFTGDFVGDEDDESFSEPVTTDKVAKTIASPSSAFWKYGTRLVCREEEDKKKISEESEHGNADLNNRNFGGVDGNNGASYATASVKKGRVKNAIDKMNNGSPEEREKASQTLQTMQQNAAEQGMDLQTMIAQLDNAEKASKNNREYKAKNGQRILAQHTRNSNGTAHSNNKEIINYF